MSRLALALSAAAVLALGVPAAHADPIDETVQSGNCGGGYAYDNTPGGTFGGQATNIGTIVGTVVLWDPDSPATVVGGWLTCSIRINGVEWALAPAVHGYTVVAVPPTLVQFTATPADYVEFCTGVQFDLGASYHQCAPAGPPAQAFAFCPHTQFSGTKNYTSTPPGPLPSPVTWTASVQMTCAGNPPVAGSYSLSLTGSGTESCWSGSGTASFTGTGPSGPVSGSLTYAYSGFLHGTIVVAGQTYVFDLVMFGTATSFPPCPLPSSSPLLGFASIA